MRKILFTAWFITAGCTHTNIVSTPNNLEETSKGISYFLPVDVLVVDVIETNVQKVEYNFETDEKKIIPKVIQKDPVYQLTPSIERRPDVGFSYSLFVVPGTSSRDDLTIQIDNKGLLTSVTFNSSGQASEVIKGIAGTIGTFTALSVGGALSGSDNDSVFSELMNNMSVRNANAVNGLGQEFVKKEYSNTSIEMKYALQESEKVRNRWLQYLNILNEENILEAKGKDIFSSYLSSEAGDKRKIHKENYELTKDRIVETIEQREDAYSEFITEVSQFVNSDTYRESTSTKTYKMEFHFDEIPVTGTDVAALTGKMKTLYDHTDHYYTAHVGGSSLTDLFSPKTNSEYFKRQLETALRNTDVPTRGGNPVLNPDDVIDDTLSEDDQSDEQTNVARSVRETNNTVEPVSVMLHAIPENCINSSCVFYRNSLPVQLKLCTTEKVITDQHYDVIPRFKTPNYIENITSIWSKKDVELTFSNGELITLHKVSDSSAEKMASAAADSSTSFVNSAKTTASSFKDFTSSMIDIKTRDLALDLKKRDLENQILGKEREILKHEGEIELNEAANTAAILEKQKAIDLYESILLKERAANEQAYLQSQRAIDLHELDSELAKIGKDKEILDKKYELDTQSLTYEDRVQLEILNVKEELLKAKRSSINAGVAFNETIISSLASREAAITSLLNEYQGDQAKTEALLKEIISIVNGLDSN